MLEYDARSASIRITSAYSSAIRLVDDSAFGLRQPPTEASPRPGHIPGIRTEFVHTAPMSRHEKGKKTRGIRPAIVVALLALVPTAALAEQVSERDKLLNC